MTCLMCLIFRNTCPRYLKITYRVSIWIINQWNLLYGIQQARKITIDCDHCLIPKQMSSLYVML